MMFYIKTPSISNGSSLCNPAATRSRNCFQSPKHSHFFTNTLTLCRLLASLLSKSLSTECIKLCCSDGPNTTKAIALAAKTYRISLARGVCVNNFSVYKYCAAVKLKMFANKSAIKKDVLRFIDSNFSCFRDDAIFTNKIASSY